MQIENMNREAPAQHQKASHLRPGYTYQQRVRPDIKGWRRAEFPAPASNGSYVTQLCVQHVGDHAQHARQVAVGDLVFEIADDDIAVMAGPIHPLTRGLGVRR